MNILFICSRNRWRSLTAETIYKNHALHQIKSAGTAKTARIKVNFKLINWADLIFVMERKHQALLKEMFPAAIAGKQIITLGIKDNYGYMDETLISIINEKVLPYLYAEPEI